MTNLTKGPGAPDQALLTPEAEQKVVKSWERIKKMTEQIIDQLELAKLIANDEERNGLIELVRLELTQNISEATAIRNIIDSDWDEN